ncbi:hypothetical protein [Actinoplanes sp. NPDC020271]|uniref:hypothetical protein n=1 Tax=Actinoplanes sp. NPDC020271 TaxID=3363896 RepID=UPI0037BE0BBA
MLTLFTVALLAAAGFAAWPAFKEAEKATAAAGQDPGAGAATRSPTTLEGAMTAQLLDGEIKPEQYRHALERLAARDDREHPLSLPENHDPGAGA